MSVYRRGKVFYMNFILQGVRVNKSTGETNIRDARRAEQRAMRELVDMREHTTTKLQQGRDMTFREAVLKVYEEKWAQNKDGLATLNRVETTVFPLIGEKPLTEVNAEAIELVVQSLRKAGKTEATVNRYKSYLKTVLLHAHKVWEMLPFPPYIPLRKEAKKQFQVYSKKDEEKCLRILNRRHPEIADLVVVLADTGIRLGEALTLKFTEVDFDNQLITIWVNKGDLPRTVPMTSRVAEVLHRRKVEGARPFPYTYQRVRTAWDKVRLGMGWPEKGQENVHAWRHTCASRLVRAGIPLYTVKDFLGHSSITVTERYAHLAPEHLRQASAVLEAVN